MEIYFTQIEKPFDPCRMKINYVRIPLIGSQVKYTTKRKTIFGIVDRIFYDYDAEIINVFIAPIPNPTK